jgi:hypothetical protein
VSGDTRVILARDNGIHLIPQCDVEQLEQMLKQFNKLVDELRLILPNMSIPMDEFRNYVVDFKDRVIEMHGRLLGHATEQSIQQALFDPNWPGAPYPRIPVGQEIRVRISSVDDPEKKIAFDIPFDQMFPPNRGTRMIDLTNVKFVEEPEEKK